MAANKIVIVIDGVPGVFIPLRDGRIETDNPQDGQALMFDSDQGEFVNKNIGYDDVDNAPDIHVYRNLTGTPAVTTSPYHCTRWDVTDSKVTAYRDGMVVSVKVPVAGNGSYGTALQINNLGYKPVVYNVNSMIGTRYGVGSVVWAVYNVTQTAKLYLGQGHQNEDIIGCWQVMDYNSDTTTVTTVRRNYSSRVKPTAVLLSNVIVFRKNETQVVPIHSVAAGTSGTNAYTANNGTNKTMTTEEFDPFGQILWYSNSKKIDANAIIDIATLYMQYGGLIDARRIFNCGQTLVGNKELYLVVDLQSDGMVKLATDVNPWSQTLPTANDGHLYILLGITYDTYRFEFLMYHPIYYHDGTQLRMYTGAKLFSGDYNALTNKPDIPTVRTVNHEQLTDSSLGDANLHDGFYFPNAVHDADGNWYGAVVIGDQVWMAENLRTTHYADGTPIAEGGNNASDTTPYYYNPNISLGISDKEKGLYYNWAAVMRDSESSIANPSGVQGIAPEGWHIPSRSEYEQLQGYVMKQSRFNFGYDYDAKALAAKKYWNSAGGNVPGNNMSTNNTTGFNAFPIGEFFAGIIGNFYIHASFYTSVEYDPNSGDNFTHAMQFRLINSFVKSQINGSEKSVACPVRCVCDLDPVQFRNWYVEQYGSLQHRLDEVFRCEMLAQLPYGTMQGGVSYADIQSAINNGKTVFCTLYDDITSSPTVLISNIGTPVKLSGTKVNNNVLYCFEATFGGGTGSGEYWYVQYKAVQTSSMLPALSGNEGKVLSVNSNGDGVEWRAPFSGSYSDLTNKPVNANFGTGVVHSRVDNTSATINVPFSDYSLLSGGLVSIKFKNDVVANAKLNINNKGAYQIWFRNGQITAGTIMAGDRCLFMFNSVSPGYYILVSNDRWGVGV